MRTHRNTLRSKFPRKSLQLLLPLMATAWLAAPSICRATPINYVFSGASTVLNGDTETITGSFTFDTTTDQETSVSITLTGPAAEAGTFTSGTFTTAGNNQVIADQVTGMFHGLGGITIEFANPLDQSPDALNLVRYFVGPP